MDDFERTSNSAADTGTAAHLAVKLWHEKHGEDAALQQMQDRISEFPQADIKEATKFATAYFRDPRNSPEVCVGVEVQVTYSLPPHPLDKTGKRVYISGTADQIRLTNAGYEIWDYKTGDKETGWVMLHEFAPQLAGYAHVPWSRPCWWYHPCSRISLSGE
jgi:ATP-dependent exoDNAse (exonuclease V) beta subunit